MNASFINCWNWIQYGSLLVYLHPDCILRHVVDVSCLSEMSRNLRKEEVTSSYNLHDRKIESIPQWTNNYYITKTNWVGVEQPNFTQKWVLCVFCQKHKSVHLKKGMASWRIIANHEKKVSALEHQPCGRNSWAHYQQLSNCQRMAVFYDAVESS